MQNLDKLIPEDPNLPSIAYQAHEHTPICIPWTRAAVVPGIGFNTSVPSQTKNDLRALRPSALESTPGQAMYQLDPAENRSSSCEVSSAHAATSYEHLDFKGTMSAGGSFMGASGRAKFSKEVYKNKDSSKVSLHASLRIGRITFLESPRISSDALSLLRTSAASFHQKYGDYYLEALCLGADTSTFLSTSSSIDLKAEMRDIQVKAKAFWTESTVYEDYKASESAGDDCKATFCAFDTLKGYQKFIYATDRQRYAEIRGEARKTVADSLDLDKRVKQAVQALGLGGDFGDTTELTEAHCEAVCKSGLVVELLFLPYARLRDYILATSTFTT